MVKELGIRGTFNGKVDFREGTMITRTFVNSFQCYGRVIVQHRPYKFMISKGELVVPGLDLTETGMARLRQEHKYWILSDYKTGVNLTHSSSIDAAMDNLRRISPEWLKGKTCNKKIHNKDLTIFGNQEEVKDV